jgi:hypothetical protein
LANINYIIFRNVEIKKKLFLLNLKILWSRNVNLKGYSLCWNEYFKIIQHRCVEMAKVLGSTTSPQIHNHIKFTADFIPASPILSHMSY